MIDHRRVAGSVPSPQLLSVPDTARMLGVKERFVWSLLSTGKLVSVKLGRRRLIDRRDVDDFIHSLKGASNEAR